MRRVVTLQSILLRGNLRFFSSIRLFLWNLANRAKFAFLLYPGLGPATIVSNYSIHPIQLQAELNLHNQ
jgi:hypothetical protein